MRRATLALLWLSVAACVSTNETTSPLTSASLTAAWQADACALHRSAVLAGSEASSRADEENLSFAAALQDQVAALPDLPPSAHFWVRHVRFTIASIRATVTVGPNPERLREVQLLETEAFEELQEISGFSCGGATTDP